MRNPSDWDETDLFNLPVGEFDWLEVKGRQGMDLTLPTTKEPDMRNVLSVAIAALANSGGGQLILGMKNPTRTKWEIDDGGIDLQMKKPTTREWLEDIIPTLVDYPLHRFNVYAIEALSPSSPILLGRAVFVIDVPDSDQAPHQAWDNKYYARVGGKSRPIGQRLVADIFARRRDPEIEIEFSILATTYIDYGHMHFPSPPRPKPSRKVELQVTMQNVGRVYAKYVNCLVYIPVGIVDADDLELYRRNNAVRDIDGAPYVGWQHSNTRRDMVKFEPLGGSQYGPSWFDPILPGRATRWTWDLRKDLTEADLEGEEILRWEIYADNASRRMGSIAFRELRFVSKDETKKKLSRPGDKGES